MGTGSLLGVPVPGLDPPPSLPDVEIERAAWPGAVGIGLVVLLVLVLAATFGGPRALTFAQIVGGFCAGNRLKAAGVGQG